MTANPISPTIPLDADGAHHGFLKLPYSRDDSAWGSVMIPISVIANGAGPTALLTGGNHGDEYEGPVALQELAATLRPEDITGRVIILPMMNTPAFAAGRRCSPIDGGNMNRSYPGRPDGTVTQKIAHYIATTLVPAADIVLDFHSGGSTLDFLPFAAAHVLEDKTQEDACMAAMQAFNAPYSVRMLEIDAVGMFDTEVETQGKTFVTTELGGAGTSTARSVAIARKGIGNLLRHAGIIAGTPEIAETVQLDMPDETCFQFAMNAGLIEYLVDLGNTVAEGQPIARIWPADRTGVAPIPCLARRDGILAARHVPGLVKMGDFVGLVAVAT
ncbi:Succinylglutamate desuccinylase / Aspartoacylase family protein [Sulfitobacter sp. THAF37]|uniref:N(2)-acetyl-L-2,4-diaminobutanoate deacetylase DoeB n=1 Tax=Sulfitobacter sp. THAF37 TaxID=2587855 RepID=UPI00126787C8|nr:N(2)-acetyl-L-2,4-diaminobutanoate deacetylase DoeB [Sulfitobacter sp. THAF37]QFT57712.1 Succinylglutamate desuccinylase / Aspartoacylase family protein [Sulfitobacter sp. THAF37]